jgi:hypothetical protein
VSTFRNTVSFIFVGSVKQEEFIFPTYNPVESVFSWATYLLSKVSNRLYNASYHCPNCNRTFENLQVFLKGGSGVRQKHNCLGFVFLAAIVTTCFGRAWPSSGHNVDVVHK